MKWKMEGFKSRQLADRISVSGKLEQIPTAPICITWHNVKQMGWPVYLNQICKGNYHSYLILILIVNKWVENISKARKQYFKHIQDYFKNYFLFWKEKLSNAAHFNLSKLDNIGKNISQQKICLFMLFKIIWNWRYEKFLWALNTNFGYRVATKPIKIKFLNKIYLLRNYKKNFKSK